MMMEGVQAALLLVQRVQRCPAFRGATKMTDEQHGPTLVDCLQYTIAKNRQIIHHKPVLF